MLGEDVSVVGDIEIVVVTEDDGVVFVKGHHDVLPQTVLAFGPGLEVVRDTLAMVVHFVGLYEV